MKIWLSGIRRHAYLCLCKYLHNFIMGFFTAMCKVRNYNHWRVRIEIIKYEWISRLNFQGEVNDELNSSNFAPTWDLVCGVEACGFASRYSWYYFYFILFFSRFYLIRIHRYVLRIRCRYIYIFTSLVFTLFHIRFCNANFASIYPERNIQI